jgi:hypothetical protein
MWEVSVNVTFAIDGDFDAGRGCRVRASGSLYLYPASSMLARCVREPMQCLGVPQLCPQFAQRYLAH